MHKPNLSRLMQILRTMRPAESSAEEAFVTDWLVPLLPEPEIDAFGNVWCVVGDGTSTTLFSSHTDTVHTSGGTQKLNYDSAKNHVFSQNTNCLGADDGTGIWLMLHLIDAKVPGTYIFHREEEVGGCGSRFIANTYASELATFKRCIAFDRKGYTDIITHQGGARTASDAFATSLAKYLPRYKACDGGSFTDSKNYRHIIPECTNLAVGYFAQHTKDEYQDVAFAVKLANSLVQVPWEMLVTARDPLAVELPKYNPPRSRDWYYGGSTTIAPPTSTYAPRPAVQRSPLPNRAELRRWVREHPLAAAEILFDYGVHNDDLLDAEHAVKDLDQPMVVQRPADVRALPSRGQEAVSRPPAAKTK